MPKPKYTLGQVKRHLQEQPHIKFSGLSREAVGNKLTKFLKEFFKNNSERDTIFTNNKVQTKAGSRRSIGDIYRLCYYYFPKIKLTTVYSTLISQIAAGDALSAICEATKMRVYRGTKKGYDTAYFNGEAIDEWGTDINQFEDLKKCAREVGSWGVGSTAKNLKFIEL